jgi:cytochrome c553
MARKILLAMAFVLTLCVTIMFYLMFSGPSARDVTDLKVLSSPERVARGEYLANSVLSCVHCHTRRDHDDYSLPATGPAFAGGDCLDEPAGFPGAMCTPNITSDVATGIGDWTDDEILRAIREGISRQGTALFPLMPYDSYRYLPDEDAYALVAYLRTLAPIESPTPETVVNFPMNYVVSQFPEPLDDPVPEVSPSDEHAYGEYLAIVTSCRGCHSNDIDNFSGGQTFPLASGPVTSPNLTSHETGVVPDNFDDFVQMFRQFSPENEASAVTDSGHSTVMPWRSFAGLTDEDLRVLFLYLQRIPPYENEVQVYGTASGV